MICSKCKELGLTSKLYPNPIITTTLLGWNHGYYDESGEWVNNQDPNTKTQQYSCSNDHQFSISWKGTKTEDNYQVVFK